MKRNRINILELIERVEKEGIVRTAAHYGISRVTLNHILKDLNEKDILVGRRFRVKYARLGFVDVMIGINCEPQFLMHVKDELVKIGAIKELYRVSGDHDFIARAAGSKGEVENLMKTIEKIEGVKNVYPAFIEDIIK